MLRMLLPVLIVIAALAGIVFILTRRFKTIKKNIKEGEFSVDENLIRLKPKDEGQISQPPVALGRRKIRKFLALSAGIAAKAFFFLKAAAVIAAKGAMIIGKFFQRVPTAVRFAQKKKAAAITLEKENAPAEPVREKTTADILPVARNSIKMPEAMPEAAPSEGAFSFGKLKRMRRRHLSQAVAPAAEEPREEEEAEMPVVSEVAQTPEPEKWDVEAEKVIVAVEEPEPEVPAEPAPEPKAAKRTGRRKAKKEEPEAVEAVLETVVPEPEPEPVPEEPEPAHEPTEEEEQPISEEAPVDPEVTLVRDVQMEAEPAPETQPQRVVIERMQSAVDENGGGMKRMIGHMEKEENQDLVLAAIWMDDNDLDRAESLLIDVINRNPREIKGYLLLGTIYQRKRDNTQALEVFEEAYKRDPEFPGLLGKLGEANFGLGKYSKALVWFQMAHERDESNLEHLEQILKIFSRMDRRPLIRTTANKMLKIDPQNAAAQKALERIEA